MNEINTINGVICINKPQDFTSFDVVAIMRRAAGTRKIGHGGTLDPMATGVLPIYIGRAAKTADLNPVSDKKYRATFRLGVTTDTEDVWGKVLTEDEKPVTLAEITDAVKAMQGDIMQMPPMYSAVKINGKRLYDLARQGIEVERAARPVTVYSIELSDYDRQNRTGTLDIHCSKGTYIRTIISDIGKKLGTGAIMTSLCRTMAAGFTLSDCHDIEKLRNMPPEDTAKLVLPTERVFSCYDEVSLDDAQKKLFMNGMILDCGRMGISYPADTRLRLKHGDTFIGVAKVNEENGLKSVYLNIIS
jgi:tRNA pseudouridine55 synthase